MLIRNLEFFFSNIFGPLEIFTNLNKNLKIFSTPPHPKNDPLHSLNPPPPPMIFDQSYRYDPYMNLEGMCDGWWVLNRLSSPYQNEKGTPNFFLYPPQRFLTRLMYEQKLLQIFTFVEHHGICSGSLNTMHSL